MPDRKLLLVALVAALLVLGVGGTTQARWSDSATITGTDLRTGRLDLTVDGQDAVTGYDALDVAGLVPGGSTAAVLTVHNAGNVPLDYSVAITGTDPDGKGLAAAVARTVTGAATTDGATCGGAALGASTTLAPGGSDPVCVQLALPAGAPASLAAAATDLTITVHGTVQGAWTDDGTVTGTHLATATLTAPTLSCGTAGIGSIMVRWNAVPGATGYRIHYGTLGGLVQDVPASTLSTTFTAVAGTVTVQAIFGSTTWLSPASNQLSYDALSALTTATCS